VRGHNVNFIWEPDPTLHAPPRYKRGCRYDAFVPDLLEDLPLLAPAVAGAISAAEEAIHQLNTVAQPGLQPLARLLLRTEAIASSKVEGMQASAQTLARDEAKSDLGFPISIGSVEILANVDAMQLAIDDATEVETLTLDGILDTHRALMARTISAARVAGVIRDQQNWIGGNDYNPCGASFVPPPPEHIERLLADLVRFCNDESLPPLAQAALAHAQFETIHPFIDGNGRTGRALVQVILRRRGLAPDYVPPISVVLAADKSRYIEGLVAFREGREDEWLETFALASTRAAELAASYLVEVQKLQDVWRESLTAQGIRADSVAWPIIDLLPAHPIISGPVVGAALSRTKMAVNRAIAQLVAAGVLTPLSESKRNRQWEAVGLLDLSAELETLGPR